MDKKIEEKVERFKKTFFEEYGFYPTKTNVECFIKEYTKSPNAYQKEMRLQLKKLKYLLDNPLVYKHWKSSVAPIFENIEVLAKQEMEDIEKWWRD